MNFFTKKNIIIVIVILLVIVASIGGVIFLKGRKPAVTKNEKAETTKELPVMSKEEVEKRKEAINQANIAYDTALKTDKPDECLKIENAANKNICLEAYAVKKADESVCRLIDDKIKKEDCEIRLLSQKIMKEKDMNMCQDLKNENLIKTCVARIAIELKYTLDKCGTVSQNYKDVCTDSVNINKAIMEKNKQFCSDIKDFDLKNECLSAF
jgi:hypothetical protein